MKTACVALAHGCVRSEAEISLFSRYLEENGFNVSDDISSSDLVLVSACGFDNAAEICSVKLLGVAKKKLKKTAKMIVVGCLPGINSDIIRQRFGTEVIPLAPENIHDLDGIIGAEIKLEEVRQRVDPVDCYVRGDAVVSSCSPSEDEPEMAAGNISALKAFSKFDRSLAHLPTSVESIDKLISRLSKLYSYQFISSSQKWIPGILVARGCLGNCSYCAIKNASGPLVSVPLETIRKAVAHVVSQGHQLASVVAGDVGAYGQDIGLDVTDLMEVLFSHDDGPKWVLNDFNFEWLVKYSDRLIDLFSKNQDKIDHLKLPIQSGSDKVLKLMSRRYTRAEIEKHITLLKSRAPDLKISTHILVGFPGEEDSDFQQTVSMLEKIEFDYITVFKYTDRPGTPSSKLPNKVPAMVKRKRLWSLHRRFPGIRKA